jgi:hypothetical protein
MATFTVDPTTLEQLSQTLSGIHSEMQSMHGVVTGYAGLLGGSDLEGQIEGFCGTWGYGIGQLSDHMKTVVELLDAAGKAYGRSEAEIAGACTPGG